jgi:N-acetylmuramoyl-L-alanine amidase
MARRYRRRRRTRVLFQLMLVIGVLVESSLALIAAGSAAILKGAAESAPAAVQVPVQGVRSGACMSFAPARGKAGKTVFLDPGHGGLDPGVVGVAGGHQVLEKDVALAVASRLATVLRADGYRVVMSRVGDTSVAQLSADDALAGALMASAVHRDLVARVACANAAGASALLSIHLNAFDDPSVGGTETLFDSARQFAPENERLARDVQAAAVAGLGTADRGVWRDDDLAAPTLTPSGSMYGHLIELGPVEKGWVDDPSRMPGALVEPLFLTNPNEARYAADPSGQQRIALALKRGLEAYLTGR